jgi:hypothetical protein
VVTKKLRAYLLGFSNSFQNLDPKYKRQFCIRNPELSLNHFYTFFLSLYTFFLSCTFVEPYPTFCSSPHPSTFKLPEGYVCVYIRAIRPILPSVKRLEVEIGSCWRVVFFKKNLIQKSRLGVGFRKSWRCSY